MDIRGPQACREGVPLGGFMKALLLLVLLSCVVGVARADEALYPALQLVPNGNAASECKSVALTASPEHPGRFFGRLYYEQDLYPHTPQWITVYAQQVTPNNPKSDASILWSISDHPPRELQ